MFDSGTACPVDPDVRDWIERRMAWLVEQFGRDRLQGVEVVLPESRYFPDPYSGREEDVRRLVDRVCEYMGIPPDTVDLGLYYDQRPSPWGVPVRETAGVYTEEGERFKVWLEEGSLGDPIVLVATIAHELGHVLLLGHRRIAADAVDHEPLTDLVTVFMGMGVFILDSALRERNWRDGLVSWSQMDRLGYLTIPMLGYAFAVFANLRGEMEPQWAKHLRPDARKVFRQGLKFLAARGAAGDPLAGGSNDVVSHSIRSLAPRPPAAPDPDHDEAISRCSFCGALMDVPLGGEHAMCETCRSSVATNETALLAEQKRSDWDGMKVGTRWAIAGAGAVVLLTCVVLLLRALS